MKAKNKEQLSKEKNLTTSLHQAALFGDLKKTIDLAKQAEIFNKQLTTVDNNDNLPLDRACPRGHYAIVKILVEAHKKPGNEYVMHNKQNYYPFLSTARWYLKALDGINENEARCGHFNSEKMFSQDYMNILRLLAQEYPEHVAISDNKGCNALVYAIYHFHNALIAKDSGKISAIKVLLEFLIKIEVPVQKSKIPEKIWDNVAPIITSIEKDFEKRKNIASQNNAASTTPNPWKANNKPEQKQENQEPVRTNKPVNNTIIGFFDTAQSTIETEKQNYSSNYKRG
ncbi:hypothetical protein [uncultured Legionella sp.]|uniref:hypothetical protein n=1 Tax=uncultured Legionella sp. TaxID=210934 RepID=UPI002630CC76|nr:hypothetical protein [uncultured Legionella sp.]